MRRKTHVTDTTASEEVRMSQAEHLKALEDRFSLVKEALKILVKRPESEQFTNAFKALQEVVDAPLAAHTEPKETAKHKLKIASAAATAKHEEWCERQGDDWLEDIEYEHFANGAATFLPEVEELLELPDDAGLSAAFALIMQLSNELQRHDDKVNYGLYDGYLPSYDRLDDMMLRVINRRFELDRDRGWINQALLTC